MPILNAKDLEDILSDWDQATYTLKSYIHPSNNSICIPCIFYEKYIEIEDIGTDIPTATFSISSLPSGYGVLDRVGLNGRNYTVREIRDSSIGFVDLILGDD